MIAIITKSEFVPGEDVFSEPLSYGKIPIKGYVDFLQAIWESSVENSGTNAATTFLLSLIDSMKESLNTFITQSSQHAEVYSAFDKNGTLFELKKRLDFYQAFTVAMSVNNTQTWGQLGIDNQNWPWVDDTSLSGNRAQLITKYVAFPLLYGRFPADFSSVARGALIPASGADAASVFRIWNNVKMTPGRASEVFSGGLKDLHRNLSHTQIYGGGGQSDFAGNPFDWAIEHIEAIGRKVESTYKDAVGKVEEKGGHEWWVWGILGLVGVSTYWYLRE